MNGRLRLVFAVIGMVALAASTTLAGKYSENFDSYTAGSEIIGQGGWEGWDNDGTKGAMVSDAVAFSGPNSLETAGMTDVVQPFDIVGGKWTVEAMQYIPGDATGSAWFILMNQYPADIGSKDDWSVQINFNLDTDNMPGRIHGWVRGGDPAFQGGLDVIRDQWVPIRVEVDLDNNTVDQYYNNELLVSTTWYGTQPAIEALNLYAGFDLDGNGSPGTSPIYYDNINVVPEPATLSLLGLGLVVLMGLRLRRRRR
jgi:hypothetical protein